MAMAKTSLVERSVAKLSYNRNVMALSSINIIKIIT